MLKAIGEASYGLNAKHQMVFASMFRFSRGIPESGEESTRSGRPIEVDIESLSA